MPLHSTDRKLQKNSKKMKRKIWLEHLPQNGSNTWPESALTSSLGGDYQEPYDWDPQTSQHWKTRGLPMWHPWMQRNKKHHDNKKIHRNSPWRQRIWQINDKFSLLRAPGRNRKPNNGGKRTLLPLHHPCSLILHWIETNDWEITITTTTSTTARNTN